MNAQRREPDGPCREFDDWLCEAERPDAPPATLQAHLRDCGDCRQARARWQGAIGILADATAAGSSGPVPDLDRVLRAVSVRHRPRRRPIRPFAIAAMAAVLVAALAWTLVRGLPDGNPVDSSGTASERPAGPPPHPAFWPGGAGPGTPFANPEAVPPVHAGQRLDAIGTGISVADARVGGIVLDPGARMVVESWSEEDVRLRLEEGRIEADVLPRRPGAVFEIRTDLARVRVVGTRFVVDHRPGDRTRITGIEGRVAVSMPDGAAIAVLTAGQTVRVGPGVAGGVGPADDSAVGQGPPTLPTDRVRAARAATSSSPLPDAAARRSPPTVQPGTDETADDAPERAARLLEQARALLRDGQDLPAARLLGDAVRDLPPPERPRLLAALGDAWRLAGRPSEARQAYEASLGERPREAPERVMPDLAAIHESTGALDEAARTWRAYLVAWPQGAYANRALWSLADLAERSGRVDEALSLWRRLVAEVPFAPEAPAAFAKVGRTLADLGRLEPAEAWFAARDGDPDPAFDEASLIGRMRTRLLRGDRTGVASLLGLYDQRHPDGLRRGEAERFRSAVSSPAAGGSGSR